MQSWPTQTGQCIFCTFRSIARSSARRTAFRNFQSGAALARDRPKEGARKQDDRARQREWSVTRSHRAPKPGFRALGHERLGRRSRRIVIDPREAIKNEIGPLREALETSRSSKDPAYTQYASLDPENIHWKSFEHKLETVCSKGPEEEEVALEPELEELKQNLADGLQDKGSAGLQKALYFAFIDHVIARGAVGESDKVKQYADLRYPTEWYPSSRQLQREIHLHVGPTNSGKTYNALKRLEEAGNGFYAGPLRLLAHEVYSRFQAKGIACDLVTGDDVRVDESGAAAMTSSTVEMVDTAKAVDVAVIDEIQMMAQEQRGWAWTRAFLGTNAKEVHLCGETRVVPLIRELAASMGDTLHIHQYDRLNPLKAMSRSLRGNLKNLRKGDCIVSFTIMGIHALKTQIEIDTGRRVAIVYGGLPPETRTQQAALFNDPNNEYDFLVASDAIGMGLNLAIKRIIFETVHKSNGVSRERLAIPQLKQIAGRAGRYRTAQQVSNKNESDFKSDSHNISASRVNEYHATATVGLVTCLDQEDLPYIQKALRTEPEPITQAAILPPAEFVDDYASHLPKGVPFEYILQRLRKVAVLHPRYSLCLISDQLKVATHLESVRNLAVVERYMFCAAPAAPNDPVIQRVVQALGKSVADKKMVTIADIDEIPLEVLERDLSNDKHYLKELETLHKALVLFLWLSYRFGNVFKDREMAMYAKSMCEEKINRTLLEFSANPKLKKRLELIRQMAASKAASAKATEGLPCKEDPESEEDVNLSFASGVTDQRPEPTEAVEQPPLPGEGTVRKAGVLRGAIKHIPLNGHAIPPENNEARALSVQG